MKAILYLLTLLVLLVAVAEAQVNVPGYFRKDGTYVQPHQRSSPDGRPENNYNFPRNYNPNTGQITPGDPYRRDTDRDGTPDILDPTPYGNRSGGRGGLWGQ